MNGSECPLLAHSGHRLVAQHMSAFGAKADMAVCENPLLRSLLGVKRTCVFAAHMSAFDPKRISPPSRAAPESNTMTSPWRSGCDNETAGISGSSR